MRSKLCRSALGSFAEAFPTVLTIPHAILTDLSPQQFSPNNGLDLR